MFAKPLCINNVLQPSSLPGRRCNTLSHSGLAMLIHGKECFDVAHGIEQSGVTQKRQHLTKNNVKLNFANRNARTCQSHMSILFLEVVFKLPLLE